MHYRVKIISHEQAIKETVAYLGKKAYMGLRSELSKSRTAKECLKYTYLASEIAGFGGRAVIHAVVREAMTARKLTQQATDLMAEGIANAEPSCKRQGSCSNTCPERTPCDKGKAAQMQADALVKLLLSTGPLFNEPK